MLSNIHSVVNGLEPIKKLTWNKNLEVDGCPSKENVFRQSALLVNAMYIEIREIIREIRADNLVIFKSRSA